jgi:hypothetical protein
MKINTIILILFYPHAFRLPEFLEAGFNLDFHAVHFEERNKWNPKVIGVVAHYSDDIFLRVAKFPTPEDAEKQLKRVLKAR